ncbi:EAL domain-containing protein [Oscillatoriales cyanobacterium LEGE 11467]|uniref:EAL domain-containing protein n=1 Tax=Zarconia navalis LEGE 11467 TaxID=1828826 RepID=A0A928VX59_9CYAN|nr:EAL domain-containing protein [Zarconia navalis]MBE9041862.1 EAL domain-containing protein [Zarconia navalis LEGE 11467]
MNETLNVLIVEDSEDDALLLLRELRRGQFDPNWERVQTGESLRKMLTTRTWDAIVSDYSLPGFNAPAALEIVKQSQLDIPFIVISGAIGERSAVEMMKAGAHDYLMKDNLTRLPEAIRRELRDARIRAERQQAQVVLKQQQAAIEAAIDGIAILQGDTYLYTNQAHLKLFGYQSSQELVGKSWRLLYSPEEVERFEREIFPVLESERAWQGEVTAKRKDGSIFSQGLSLTLTEDERMISVCRDISNLKHTQDLLIYNTLHDPLTGLPNRKLLLERLELAINRAKRIENYQYAVLFLDLDRFKVVNDSLGHFVGDKLLVTISQKLKMHLRNTDLVARLGGDEFVILLEDIDSPEDVIQVVDRILAACQTPFEIDGYEIFTGFSIGIVMGNPDYHEAASVMRDADIAMYRAKAASKNSSQFFDAAMHTQVLNRVALETDLRKALEREEFVVYYQPIFDLQENQPIGFEALVRWQHPTRGFIPPDEFISVAEETGSIVHLDRWVLEKACQQIANWNQKFALNSPLKISINLSVQDLHQASLIREIDRVLAETELAGNCLTLEITESLLISEIDRTVDLLAQFASREIEVGIDDFGTGYSSLGYLHRFPVNNLKIDRSFVARFGSGNREDRVVDTIVTLGKQLGLSVTAEGIETTQQLEQLQKLGCEFGQGYLFSKPLAAAEIERLYFSNRSSAGSTAPKAFPCAS